MTEREHRWAAPVVVGVDGSDDSLAAVEPAAREAAARGCPLRVVHAFVWAEMRVSLEPPPGAPPDAGLRHVAEEVVREAVARAHRAAPEVTVRGEVVPGRAVPVLLGCARTAALVVIGDRGLGGFTGLVVGSVAVALAAHARCPVLVVRGAPDRPGPVVVGVDGSPAAAVAVELAVREAAAHGVPLLAVHARRRTGEGGHAGRGGPTGRADRPGSADATDPWSDEDLRAVAASVDDGAAAHPEVVVEHAVVQGDPRAALVDASRRARLLVVGARGRGGIEGLLLGSVSQAVLHHAACPVLVVPHTVQRDDEGPGRRPGGPGTA